MNGRHARTTLLFTGMIALSLGLGMAADVSAQVRLHLSAAPTGAAPAKTVSKSKLSKKPLRQNPEKPSLFTVPGSHETLTVPAPAGWKLADEKTGKFGASDVHTLVLAPEASSHGESITVSFYPAMYVPAMDFMTMMKKQSENMLVDTEAKFQWKTLSRPTTDNVLFEYSLANHPNFPPQLEIHRAFNGMDGLYTITYHTREMYLSPERHRQWLNQLNDAQLKRMPKSVSKAPDSAELQPPEAH